MKKKYVFTILFLSLACLSHAQLFTEWTGLGDWNTGSNWNNGYGYGQLEFKGNGNSNSNNDLNPASQWRLFFQGSQEYTLTGNQVNLYDFGGQHSWILSQSSADQTINFDVSFSDAGARPAWITTEDFGDLIFNGNIDVAGGVTELYIANTPNNFSLGRILINGSISGDEDIIIGLDQNFAPISGYIEFTGNNTYTGDTIIAAGTLTVSGNGNLGANADVFISSGTILNVTNNLTVETVQENGFNNGSQAEIAAGASLTLNGNNKGNIYQNAFHGDGDLNIETTGTTVLNLYGNSGLTGTTTVKAGSTLKLLNSMPNSDIVIEAGAHLIIEGSNPVTIKSLTIEPPVIFGVRGTVTINGDQSLNVTGDIINEGSINLSTTPGGDLVVGGYLYNSQAVSYNLISNGRTVIFDGNANQSFYSVQSTVFDNISVNKTGGTLTFNSRVQIGSDYTQTGGDVIIPADIFGYWFIADNFTISGGTFTIESSSTIYPSLMVNTATGNITYSRHVNGNSILGSSGNPIGNNDLITPPVSGQTFGDFAASNSNLLHNPSDNTEKAFANFDKTNGEFVNYNTITNASTILNAGVGYRAATNDTSNLEFTGTINTGIVTTSIMNSGIAFERWNLIGNPYPSYMYVNSFLQHEVSPGIRNIDLFSSSTAGIYGHDGYSYDILNLANTDNFTVLAPGQGFFVSAHSINAALYDVEFIPTMRGVGTSDDFINGRNSELIYLKLNASTNTNSDTTDFYFNNNSSLGFDLGYDAALFGTTPNFAIYSHLVEDNEGEPIGLQSLSHLDLSEVTIPLGVNANQGEQLTFSIEDMTLPATVQVYLEDVVANTVTLLNNSNYVISPTTALSGTGRFFLRTSEDALSTIDNSIEKLNIFHLISSKELVISGQLKENSGLNLYDVQGRKVLNTNLDSNLLENRIDVSNLNTGVYVVTVQNSSQQITKKIIIK